MLVKDQLYREIELHGPVKRIVSLVPSQTELLVDLGLRDRLVGITKFCVHPKDLRKEVAVVGGTKNVHFDKIYASRPDLIICNKEENTEEMVRELELIAPVWVSDIVTIEDSLEMIWLLGDLLGVAEIASEIIKRITSEKNAFQKFMEGKPSKRVAYLIWKNPYMAAGTETFIHSLLLLNKFQNISSAARYPEVSLDQLKEADLVLLSTEPYPFKDEDISELNEKINADVKLVDGEYFSWYGSRLERAFNYFRTLH
jgi:ABC-type Fe3+-hydroxamate transport system substrate-binding protein